MKKVTINAVSFGPTAAESMVVLSSGEELGGINSVSVKDVTSGGFVVVNLSVIVSNAK